VQAIGTAQADLIMVVSIQFRWLSSLPLLGVTFLLVLIALNALVGAQSLNAPMRETLFDYFQRLKPAPVSARSPIHVVLIDRESIKATGPWPWPRTLIAELTDAAVNAGARGVLIAEPMDEPDPLSPETIGEFWLKGAQDEALAEQLALLPRTNEVLAKSLARVPSAVGIAAGDFGGIGMLDENRADTEQGRGLITLDQNVRYLALPSARTAYPLNNALSAATTPAVLAQPADRSGVVRRTPLFWALDETPRPALAVEAARLATERPSLSLSLDRASVSAVGKPPVTMKIGERRLALDDEATLRHYFPRRSSVSTTSAASLLAGTASNAPFNDAVVIIGRDSEMGPGVRTPGAELAPAMLHAMVADQIVKGHELRRPIWIGYIEALAVMVLGAGAIMAAQRLQFWQAVAFAGLGAVTLLVVSGIVFATNALLFNPLLPGLAMFVGALSVAGGKSVGTVLFDDNVRSSFRGLLPENAMRAMRNKRDQSLLTGTRRKTTVLACELRLTDDDLASLDQSPEVVSEIIAAASHSLKNTIVNIGGTVDQAEGGRVFAYFNVPLETADHVEKACAAALAMIESMDRTNAELSSSRKTENIQVHLAIGISTGYCYVGPMGHGRMNRYSAIGAPVDLAGFLRRQSEFYGPAIICDDQVYRECHHKFAFLELDRLATAFSERPLNIHALIGNPFIKSSKSFRDLDASHRAMLQAYRSGDADEATRHLETVRKFPAARIALYDVYADRIAVLREAPTAAPANGVHQPAL